MNKLLLLFISLFVAFQLNAATITSSVTGNWSATGTWLGGVVPGLGDDVIIASGDIITVDGAISCNSLTVNAPAANNGITISGTNSLAVTGAIIMTAPTVSFNSTINVGAGTLSAASFAIPGGSASARFCLVTVSTGTISVTGNITFSGTAAQARLTFTGAGTVNVGGTLSAGGTFTRSTGTVNFNGGATIVPAYAYNNVTFSNSGVKTMVSGTTFAGSLTLSGTASATTVSALTISGNLDVGSGTTFATGVTNTFTLTVSGTTTITGTLTLANTGAKTFTGDVTINFGGTWNETGAAAINYAGSLNNSGTFTASTGIHTFNGTGIQTLSGVTMATLVINKTTGSVNLGSAITTTNFTLTAGTFDATTFLLTAATPTLTAGTLRVGAAAWAANYSFTPIPPAGFTIEYYNNNPTINAAITYTNLQFSGSGTAGASGILTIKEDLANTGGGTLDFGSNNVILSSSANNGTFTIDGFTTTGSVSFTKTTGDATFTGNVNGGALIINGNTQILNLGVGLTHTFTGTWTRTAGTLDGGSSLLKIGGAVSGTGGTFTANAGTVEWNAAGPQTLAGVTYNNLTLSGSDTKTLGAATIVNGALTINPGVTLATANLALTFGGNFTNSGTFTAGSSAITIATNSTQSIDGFTTTGSVTMTKTGGGVATLQGNVNGGALIINGGGGTLNLGAGLTHTFTGVITLSAGTLNGGSSTLNENATSAAAWGGTGTNFTAGTSTVVFGAAGAQTISATTTTFYNLNINSAGVTISSNTTVNGTLTFSSGKITTNANNVILGSSASISGDGIGKYVFGNIRWNVPTGAPSMNFAIGDAVNYAPATVAFSNVTVPGTLTGSVTNADNPQILTSGINSAKSVNHSWTLTNSLITFSTADVTFNWVGVPTDADAGSNPANYVVAKLDGTTWSMPSVASPTATSIQATGITSFSAFQVGESFISGAGDFFRSAATGNWGDLPTWQSSPDNSIWGAATSVPTSSAASITISSGNIVTMNVNNQTASTIIITGTLTNGGSNNLFVSGNWTNNGTFNRSTGTVTFNGTTQTIGGSTTIFNNVSTSGSTNTSTGVSTTIAGNLSVGDGTTFTCAGFTITVTGTTIVGGGTSGTLAITSTTGTKTFTGLVTINAGGTWNNSANELITFSGGITNNGTFTAGTAVQTFNTTEALNGTFSIPQVDVTGTGTITLTNNGSLTVTTALTGSDGLVNAATGTLNIIFTGALGITTLDATATGNTVNYGFAGTQTIKVTTYYNLTISASGAKTTASGVATTTVNGTLSIQGTSTFALGTSSVLAYGASGTLEFKGSSAQTTGAASPMWPTLNGPFNLIINNSSGVTLAATAGRTLNGTLTLTSGTLTQTTALTLGNSATISRSGGSLAAVPFFGTSLNVNYLQNGSPITTGPELPPSATILNNLTINTSNGVILNAPATANGIFALTSGLLTTTSANILTLGIAATVSGGSSSSFVNGPISVNLRSDNLIAPVGKGTAYRPLFSTVSISAGSAVITVEQMETEPAQTIAAGLHIQAVSKVRYFHVSIVKSGDFDAQANVTLTWGPDDGVTDIPRIFIVAGDNTANPAWIYKNDDGGTSGDINNGTVTSLSASAGNLFADFILGTMSSSGNPLNTPHVLTLTAMLEAMYISGSGMNMSPLATVELHNAVSPYALVESQTSTLTNLGVGTFSFASAVNGTNYYIIVKSANTIETWSAAAHSFTSGALSYDFTTGYGQALTDGSNFPLKFVSPKYCIYSGDVNQDGFITNADYIGVDNDAGLGDYHLVNDLNGDGFVTNADFISIDNNSAIGIQVQRPPDYPGVAPKHFIKSHVQQKSLEK